MANCIGCGAGSGEVSVQPIKKNGDWYYSHQCLKCGKTWDTQIHLLLEEPRLDQVVKKLGEV